MLGKYPDTTKVQYLASLFLKEGDSPKRPEQGRRASPGHLHGFRHRATQEDSISEEDIQRQKLLESIADTFQLEGNMTTYQLSLMPATAIKTVSLHSICAVVSPNPPKAFAVQLEGGGALQPSFRRAEFPIVNIGCEHGDISAMSYSQTSRILGRPAIVQWDGNNVFLSHPSRAEPLTVNTDPEIDKNTILSGLTERFDVVARREDNWDERGGVPVRSALAFSRQLPQIGLYYSYASPQLDEAEKIKSWYRNEVSKIPEVEQIVCKQNKKNIEFIVAVDRIRRTISQQLSRVEFQVYNKYTDWFFDFEHVGIRTFSQWSLNGYDNLFSRK